MVARVESTICGPGSTNVGSTVRIVPGSRGPSGPARLVAIDLNREFPIGVTSAERIAVRHHFLAGNTSREMLAVEAVDLEGVVFDRVHLAR